MPNREADVAATRVVRALLSKRGIDVSRADVRVTHGICFMRGLVAAMPGVPIGDLESELNNVAKALRSKQDIRDVVLEVNYRR